MFNKIVIRKVTVFIFFLINAFNTVVGQTRGIEKTYTLEDCINIALQSNPEIILAQNSINQSRARLTNAFGNYLPSADFNFSYSRQLNVEGGKTVNVGGQIIPIPAADPNSYSMSASAGYVLFDGFSREANYNSASYEVEAQFQNYYYLQQKIKANIYRLYFDVMRKQQIIKIRQENLDLGKKEYERIKAQYDAGLVHIGYVYAQEAEISNRELELINAESDLRLAKSNLLIAMGTEPDIDANFVEITIPNNLTEEEFSQFRAEIGNFPRALDIALNNRKDYEASKNSLYSANNLVTSAKSGYYPTISARGGWTWANSSFTKFGELGRTYLGLNFSLPIFENFRTNYQIESSKLQVTQKELELKQLELNIRSNLQNAFLQLEASEKQVLASRKALKASELNFNVFKERFNVGTSSISEYYDANNKLVIAKINLINSIYNYLLAQKEILFAIGKI